MHRLSGKDHHHRVSGKVRHASTIRKCGGFVPINLPIPSEKENDRPEHEGFSKMCSPATSTQMFKKWLLIKIRPYNLQSTTSQTWPAGSAVLDEKGISFEGEYECKRKINSGKQVRHRWNRLLLVRNNRNRLSSCAISDIGFHGRQNLQPPNRLYFFQAVSSGR